MVSGNKEEIRMASPEEQEQSMIARLPEQTGRALEDWIGIVHASGLTKHGEIVKALKTDHGVTHGYANLIAHKSLRSDATSSEDAGDLVAAQYGGARANIRPIYDAVIDQVRKFGGDVEVSPKKAYVSLRRSKQFGLLQPASTRLDVGINLKGEAATARLEQSGSFNAMVSHRVRVASPEQVDAELIGWLRQAYERS
jgi:predicted transport protein